MDGDLTYRRFQRQKLVLRAHPYRVVEGCEKSPKPRWAQVREGGPLASLIGLLTPDERTLRELKFVLFYGLTEKRKIDVLLLLSWKDRERGRSLDPAKHIRGHP